MFADSIDFRLLFYGRERWILFNPRHNRWPRWKNPNCRRSFQLHERLQELQRHQHSECKDDNDERNFFSGLETASSQMNLC
jgi:hypothetical protein